MSTRLKIAIAVVAIVFSLGAVGAANAALTDSQIQSILSLLSSFGADQATIDNVNASLNGQATSGSGSTTTGSCGFTRSLFLGVTNGEDVKCLQQYLNSTGNTVSSSGAGSVGSETTFFGSLTQNAVARWQSANSVSPAVGYFGTISRAKYDSLAGTSTGGDTGGTTAPPAQAGTVSVSLSSDNPASSTIISDDASTIGQVAVPFLGVRFTAPSTGSVTVNTLKFKRTGVSADSDLVNTWLYDGLRRVAIGGSISDGILTFNDASGIVTVSAGQSVVITLRGDLKENVGAGKTLGFNLLSSSDVTTSGASVNGVFPLTGALMTTADTTDLGYLTIGGSFATPSSDNTALTAATDVEVWKFSATANDQALDLFRMLFTKVGSTQINDLQNFRLMVGGTEIATGSMNSNFEVLMDMSANPYRITKGQTKTLSLRADILAGASRDFKMTFQQADDILAVDSNYGGFANVDLSTNNQSWTVIQPTGDYQVSSGTLSISKSTDSPSGNVALDATNVLLARYDFIAAGEDVKINSLPLAAETSSGQADGIDNGKVYLNGIQVGATTDITEYSSATTTFTFGSSFVVPAGTTSSVEVWGDVKTIAAASYTATETIQIIIGVGSSNAQGLSSLTAINAASSQQAANALTVTAGSMTISENTSFGDQTVVAGTKNVKMGSFILQAGSAEGIDVDGITVTLESDEDDDVENMYLMSDGLQVGNTKVTVSTTNLYSVTFNVPAGGSKLVDIYSDLKSAADHASWDAAITTTGIGVITGNSSNGTSVPIQSMAVGTGSLTASLAASSPDSDIIIAGSSDVTMAAYEFTATTESFTVHEMTFITASDTQDNISSVTIDYPTNGGTESKTGFFNSNATVTFVGMNFYVPADGSATLVAKANLSSITEGADSGDAPGIDWDVSDTFKAISASGSSDTDADATAPVAVTSDVAGNSMIVRKTRPTITWESLPSTSLFAGDHWVAKFTVSADAGSDEGLAWNELGLQVNLSDTDGGGELRWGNVGGNLLRIFKETDLGTALTASSTGTNGASATTSNPMTMDLASEEIISAGGSKTYRVKLYNVLGVEQDDAIVVSINSPYTTTTTNDHGTVAALENGFVWSDLSTTGSHDVADADWANAQYVDTLPSNSWVLTQ